MKRREFIKNLIKGTTVSLMPAQVVWSQENEFNGEYFLTIQAIHGWDTASWCDPKVNQPGEREITHWSNEKEIQTAGNINYAPFANNEIFFEKHYNKILAFNGINCKTSGHALGQKHNFTGSLNGNYPNIGALYAANHGAYLPFSFVTNGGLIQTSDIINPTKIINSDINFLNLLQPNKININSNNNYYDEASLRKIINLRRNVETTDPLMINRDRNMMASFFDTISTDSQISKLYETYSNIENGEFEVTNLANQAKIILSMFKSNIAFSGDIALSGFDTHSNHDEVHEVAMTRLNILLNQVWFLAEQLGIDHKLTVYVASDFSRTPWYNDGNGKDHWSITSSLIMKKGVSWTNKNIGYTNEKQEQIKFDLTTLEQKTDGFSMESQHVHAFLRDHLNINNQSLTNRFSLPTNKIIL